MRHSRSPIGASDLVGGRVVENLKFLDGMFGRTKSHSFFSHPFMSACDKVAPSRALVSFILGSFYKIVSPFTDLLCSLGDRAPNLWGRFVVMNMIQEEMGCGDLSSAHPSLYLKMLESIGITAEAAKAMPTLPAIRQINDHLREVVERRPFSVACAVLAMAEAAIPPSFPLLASLAQRAFGDIDTTFFDRHGSRDARHSDDAFMLFAANGDSSHFAMIEAEVKLDLVCRCELFDGWMAVMRGGRSTGVGTLSVRDRIIAAETDWTAHPPFLVTDRSLLHPPH